MSRLECLRKSSTCPQKQAAVKDNFCVRNNMGKNKVTDKPRSLPTQLLRSVKVSCQETQKSESPSGSVPDTEKHYYSRELEALHTPSGFPSEFSPKESIKRPPRVGKHTHLAALPDDELKMKDSRNAEPPQSILTAMPLPTLEPNGEEEQTEEEDVEDEDITAPVKLIMEFLRAAGNRDYQLASKLCQMILIYEPDNPEASEFLPLIHRKLLEEQEAEQSTEEKEDEEEEDSGSNEESSTRSRRSSSSTSSSRSDDDDEEKQVNRHSLV